MRRKLLANEQPARLEALLAGCAPVVKVFSSRLKTAAARANGGLQLLAAAIGIALKGGIAPPAQLADVRRLVAAGAAAAGVVETITVKGSPGAPKIGTLTLLSPLHVVCFPMAILSGGANSVDVLLAVRAFETPAAPLPAAALRVWARLLQCNYDSNEFRTVGTPVGALLHAPGVLAAPTLKHFVERGLDVNAPCLVTAEYGTIHRGQHGAVAAAESGDAGVDVFSPIHVAVVNHVRGSTTIDALLAAGADINARTLLHRWSALEMALDYSLSRPVDGFPSEHATFDYNAGAELANALLDAGASAVTERCDAGPSAIDSVARSGNAVLFKRLLDMGVDPTPRPINSSAGHAGEDIADAITWLQLACERGHSEVVRLGLAHGVDVNSRAPNHFACTPLQTAVIFSAATGRHGLETVKVLLAAGANVNLSSGTGTAMDSATGPSKAQNIAAPPCEVVALLEEHGAQTSLQLGFILPGSMQLIDPAHAADFEKVSPGMLKRMGSRVATAAPPCRNCGIAPAAELSGFFCGACKGKPRPA